MSSARTPRPVYCGEPLLLRRGSADFDLPMELLCCLSSSGRLLTDLCNDFGVTTHADIRVIFRDLRERGFDVRTGRRASVPTSVARTDAAPGGTYVWVDAACWPEARELAQEYWDRIYPEDKGAAPTNGAAT